MRPRTPAAAAVASLLSGCASIVSGTTQTVAINSTPDQAQVLIKDENGKEVYQGATPTTVTLPKSGGYFNGRDYSLTFTKPGYNSTTASVNSHPNGWYLLGNIIFGGIIGWFIVDPATGAMWSLSPKEVHADMTPHPEPVAPPPPPPVSPPTELPPLTQ